MIPIWRTDIFKGDKRVVLFQGIRTGLDMSINVNTKGVARPRLVQDNFENSRPGTPKNKLPRHGMSAREI